MRWKYTFLVPDRSSGRGLVEAFTKFGFPLIMAGPYQPNRYVTDPDAGADDWDVTVFDAEPDPADEYAERQRQVVGRPRGRWLAAMADSCAPAWPSPPTWQDL